MTGKRKHNNSGGKKLSPQEKRHKSKTNKKECSGKKEMATAKPSSTSFSTISKEVIDQILSGLTDIKDIKEKVSSIEGIQADINELKESISRSGTQQQKRIDNLIQENTMLKSHISDIEERLSLMECYSRRTNLIIEGVPENGEDEFHTVCKILSDKLDFHDHNGIDICHRIGKKRTTAEVVQAGAARPRPMIVRFCKYSDRMKVWNNRFSLKKSSLFLKEDFSTDVQNERKFLVPIFRHCIKIDKQTRLTQN